MKKIRILIIRLRMWCIEINIGWIEKDLNHNELAYLRLQKRLKSIGGKR